MAPTRFYFFAPTRDVPPDGPIALGSIIESPLFADQPLNREPVPIDPKDVIKQEKTDYTFKRENTISGRVGAFVSFLLQILGIGQEASVGGSWGENEELVAKVLETRSFVPSLEYLQQSCKDAAVQRFILKSKTWNGSSKLYIVTGIKIAYGASFAVDRIREGDVKLHIGIDGTNAGIPISVGPDVEGQVKFSQKESAASTEPFVFAFRMRQIIVAADGQIEDRPFTKGAPLGVRVGDQGTTGPEIRIVGLEEQDANADELDSTTWDVLDDETGDICVCARAE